MLHLGHFICLVNVIVLLVLGINLAAGGSLTINVILAFRGVCLVVDLRQSRVIPYSLFILFPVLAV